MPRANRYVLPGYAYHLTHRCHDRNRLLKFAGDRNEYRRRLWRLLCGSPVSLLSYCLTINHVHLLVTSPGAGELAAFMQRLQGEFAEWYNRRKGRSGAYWDGRYHCTMVAGARHLWNCLRYIDLNMVRAGRVAHPREWRWCGFDELTGARRRRRVLDRGALVELLEVGDLDELGRVHQERIAEALRCARLDREPEWTEAIGVGDRQFIDEVAARTQRRVSLEVRATSGGAWVLREAAPPYGPPGTTAGAQGTTAGAQRAAGPRARLDFGPENRT